MDIKKEAFIDAYQKTFGNISKSCEAINISRRTYYNWMQDDLEFKAEVDAAEPLEIMLDFAENALIERIQAKDTTAIIFALKTKGKSRGYIERQEFAGVKDQPIVWQEHKTYETKYQNNQNGLQTKSGIV